MTQSDLIEKITNQQVCIQNKMIKIAIKKILEHMVTILANGERIEIRGFGSFSLHYHYSRIGRNPKTGNKLTLGSKYVPYFKPSKKLKNSVDI